jgi:hypothetical protein
VFAQEFHSSLAIGKSAVEAYFQGIGAIKNHVAYSLMWSLPVMYSRDADVIPFPSNQAARARLAFQQAEEQLTVLDSDLATLDGMGDGRPGEWARLASHPSVRVTGIAECLPMLFSLAPAGSSQSLESVDLEMACDDLASWLRSTGENLLQLSSYDGQRRDSARADLRVRRRELDRILMNLRYAFEDVT